MGHDKAPEGSHDAPILVVDDNPDFQEVMRISLQELGYTTINAKSGAEAVDILSAGDNGIDLVILDIIMKGLSGADTFHQLRQLKPDLAVILCTGYSHNSIVEKLMAAGARDFIQKPFKMKTLAEKIRRILT